VERAVIIGAGLSGLATAYELQKQGWDVVVLEATGRLGGRVMTVRDRFSDPLHAEAGAEGINAKHSFALHYTTEFGLPLAPVRILGTRGQTLSILTAPWSIRLRFRGRVHTIPRLILNPFRIPYRLKLRERLSFPLGLTDLYTRPFERRFVDIAQPLQPDLLYLDNISFWDFLQQQGASPDAIALIEEHHLFASLKQLSALYMVWEQARRDFDDVFYRIEGGNDRLPQALADRLGARVQLNSPVKSVEQSADEMRVSYTAHGKTAEISASRVVCTTSLPALKSIGFHPILSEAKRRAVDEIHYTSLLKTQLQFETRFWEANGWSGVGYSDQPMQYLLHVTSDQAGPKGILTSFATGARAQRLAAMGDGAIGAVCGMISELDPAAMEWFGQGHVKDWDSDPWIGGTHPQFSVGQMTRFWSELGKAEGRLHFGGEHTSYWTGWMNGALESASRVVREVAGRSP
jgi:monoamine oxidase